MTDTLLEDLDLALEGHPAADADLLALVSDVRSQAPRMTPQFAAELDARVLGRVTTAQTPARRPAARRRSRLYLLAPVAAAAAAVVIVVGQSGGGSSPTVRSATSAPTGGLSDQVAKAPSVTAATPALPAPQASGSAAPAPEALATTTPGRRVERSTELSLLTTTDNLQPVAAGVVRTTQQAGGFVANSQVQIAGNHGSAYFTLRVPAARLESTLTTLGHLAKVTSMSQSTQDVTGNFRSTQTRLAALQAQLATLQHRQQTPRTIAQERRLTRQIAGQRGRLSYLRHQVDFSTIDLSITARGRHHHAAPVHHGSGLTPGSALHTAGRILEVAAGVLLIALTILIPLGLVVGALAYGVRLVRRHNREAALKAT